jgi:tetratricopeptide (TPR) repeat protein
LPTPADRAAAARRLVDHYLHTALGADRRVAPHRPPVGPADPVPGVLLTHLPDRESAWRWLEVEHPGLLAAQRLAAAHGFTDAVWQLAWAMSTLHQRRGTPEDLHATWQLASDSVGAAADPATRVLVLRHLAEAGGRLGRFDDAEHQLTEAVSVAAGGGLDRDEARARAALARMWWRRGDDRAALVHALRALELFRRCGSVGEVAAAANAVGWYAARAGDVETAWPHLRTALRLSRQLGDRLTEAHTLNSLGHLAQQTGQHERALRWLGRCLSLARANGDLHNEATTLDGLGDSYAALGDPVRARDAWLRAELLCRAQSRQVDEARVRDKLARLAGHGSLASSVSSQLTKRSVISSMPAIRSFRPSSPVVF